jgi:hypothetical protein
MAGRAEGEKIWFKAASVSASPPEKVINPKERVMINRRIAVACLFLGLGFAACENEASVASRNPSDQGRIRRYTDGRMALRVFLEPLRSQRAAMQSHGAGQNEQLPRRVRRWLRDDHQPQRDP